MTTYHSEPIDIDSLYKIPHIPEVNAVQKRYIQEPDLSYLKAQQPEAFNMLTEFVKDESKRMILLQGFAGVGKTVVVNVFVEWYLMRYRTKSVAMTATTNKAVKNLREKAVYYHAGLNYSTIHSLLGLKEVIDAYGKQKFEQDRSKPPSIMNYDLLIIDEVSMLHDELFDYLPAYLDKLKIIFVGDPAQIPPVGKLDCIPMQKSQRDIYKIDTINMTEIIRQAKGNPIIETTFLIRKNLNIRSRLQEAVSNINELGGVIYLDEHKDLDVDRILKDFYTSEDFKRNPDLIRVVGWRNDTLAVVNKRIRSYIYGEGCPKICVGEKLLADKPIKDDESEIIFTTNDEFVVEGYDIGQEVINDGQIILKFYDCRVSYTSMRGDTSIERIRIIHEESEDDYKKILKILAEEAKGHPRGTVAAKRAWEEYYAFFEHFAHTKYLYSITSHKSQGSTYDTVIILDKDICANPNIVERNRIRYTAYSRASRLVISIR
jgi:exodeoxyribonuclease-5